MFRKLFWPTVRKKWCSGQKKLLQIRRRRPIIWNSFEITWRIHLLSERSEQFWKQFFLSVSFQSDLIHWNNWNANWNNNWVVETWRKKLEKIKVYFISVFFSSSEAQFDINTASSVFKCRLLSHVELETLHFVLAVPLCQFLQHQILRQSLTKLIFKHISWPARKAYMNVS